MRAVSAATGRDVWTTAPVLPYSAQSIPVITDKYIYVSFGVDVIAVDKTTGALGTQTQPSKLLRDNEAAAHISRVELAAWLSQARALVLVNSQIFPEGGGVDYSEILDEELRFLRDGGGDPTPSGDALLGSENVAPEGAPERWRVVASEPRTGRIVWRRATPPAPFSEISWTPWGSDNLVVRSHGLWIDDTKPRTLYGVDPATGKTRWTLAVPPNAYWTTTDDALLVWLRDETGKALRVRAYLPLPAQP